MISSPPICWTPVLLMDETKDGNSKKLLLIFVLLVFIHFCLLLVFICGILFLLLVLVLVFEVMLALSVMLVTFVLLLVF